MKKNLISAIAGWKSAALLALVAMVAAVAFSGVLTSTSADAQAGPTFVVDELEYDGTNVIGDVSLENPTVPDAENAPLVASAWSWSLVDLATPATVTCTDGGTTITAATTGPPATPAEVAGSDNSGNLSPGSTYVFTAYDKACAAGAVDTTASQLGDAVTVALPAISETSLTASPGDDVDVSFRAPTGAPVGRATLSLTSDGADGKFAATGAAAVTCNDDNACDRSANIAGLMTVRVNVGEDSKAGQNLYLAGTTETDGTTAQTITIAIADPAPKAASFSVAPMKGEESAAAGTGTATIVATVLDDSKPDAKPFTGAISITFITPNGSVDCDGKGGDAPASSCTTTTTDAMGKAMAVLSGGTPGTATITAVAGKLGASSTDVTIFGAAASLEAALAADSINQGDSTFVTFTVKDAADRPVKGASITQPTATADRVTAPDVEDAVGVTVAMAQDDDDETKDAPPKDQVYCGSEGGTNAAGQCVVRISSAAGAAATTRGEHTAHFELVVDPADPTKTLTADAAVRVVGAPDDIETDAPETVEPRTRVTINVSVYDDEDNLVGGGDVTVTKLEGRGAVLGTTNGNAALTGGEASFQYYATSTDEAVVLELTIGEGDAQVTEIIEILVEEAEAEEEVVEEVVIPDLAAPTSVTIAVSDDGVLSVSAEGAAEGDDTEAQVRANGGAWAAVSEEAAAPGEYQARARFVRGDESTDWVYSSNVVTIAEPEPEPDPPTWNNELVSGQNLVVWNGEDGADPSAGSADGVTAIWSYNTGSGSWDGYFPGAADVPGGNTLTSLSNGQAYVVIVE